MGEEETKPDETKPEDPKPDAEKSGEDQHKETSNIINNANSAADRIEAATAAMNKALDRQDSLRAKQILEGKATAGEPSKKELTDKEYTYKVMSGEIEPTK